MTEVLERTLMTRTVLDGFLKGVNGTDAEVAKANHIVIAKHIALAKPQHTAIKYCR